jgi:hypothetical protein
MPDPASLDPFQERALADAAVARAAQALKEQLKRIAAAIRPFPVFPGAVFAYGIEVEPVGSGQGCVILGDDGTLYELQVGVDAAQAALDETDQVGTRHEELVPLDIPPAEYVTYAHRAVAAAMAHLDGR